MKDAAASAKRSVSIPAGPSHLRSRLHSPASSTKTAMSARKPKSRDHWCPVRSLIRSAAIWSGGSVAVGVDGVKKLAMNSAMKIKPAIPAMRSARLW